jgi:di/tricarboxylate transporter
MTFEIGLVLLIVVAALVLFASERVPVDVVALLLLVTLVALPLVSGRWSALTERGIDLEGAFPTVAEGLSGLASPATITVLAMFILSAGVQRTGAIHDLGKRLFPLVGGSEMRQLLVIALLVAPVSGVVNNTAAVAILVPMVIDLARRGGRSPARLLMPLSFFGQLGGTLTLVGTSTNLLAAAILADPAQGTGRVIRMFDPTPVGLVVLATGLVYFLTVGRLLLPRGGRGAADDGAGEERYLFEVTIPRASALVGRPLADSGFLEAQGVELRRLLRGGRSFTTTAATQELAADDVLLLCGTTQQVHDLLALDDVRVLAGGEGARRAPHPQARLVRAMLRSGRAFGRRAAGNADFWSRGRAQLVGIEAEAVRSTRLLDHAFKVGESVLLATSAPGLKQMQRGGELVVLEELEDLYDRDKRWPALAIVTAVVGIAAATSLPIVVTALAGVVAMVLTGVLPKDELYDAVSWDVIFLLAGVIPLGVAMTKSGAADFLAAQVVALAGDWPPVVVLMGLYALTTVLTEMVSNNAAAVILVPIAIAVARTLGLETLPFVMAVMFAASTSFLTPVGYQTNAMVYGTGLYRFFDFARVGGLLNLILIVVSSLAIAWFFPLASGV